MSWISGIPIVGKGIDSYLNPDKGYKDAAKQMQEYFQKAQSFQEPYRAQGLGQIGRLNTAQNELSDPSALLAKWMKSYETSPFAEKSMANAKEAGLSGASSMGLMGSSTALNNIENSAGDIMNADRSQFLSDLMQKYMAGIGIGQNMYGIGASTAGNMGNQAMEMGGNMGEMAYGAANAPGDRLAQLLSNGAKAYGAYMNPAGGG